MKPKQVRVFEITSASKGIAVVRIIPSWVNAHLYLPACLFGNYSLISLTFGLPGTTSFFLSKRHAKRMMSLLLEPLRF
jgi:hypothetical protein